MLHRFGRDEEPLREMISRVVDDGKNYVRAEAALAKATVTARVAAVRPAAILLFVVLLLVQAALTVAVAALGMGLAVWLGAAGGLAVAALLVLLLAGVLAMSAVKILKRAFA